MSARLLLNKLARDAFIGWSAQQRQQRLSLIINNSRFLILPMCACRIWPATFWALSCVGCAQTGSENTKLRRAWRRLLLSASALAVFATGRPTG
jgi:hypothetical protein